MIKIENISKRYDKENVLDKLSCTIDDNCIYGLVGANGAGKSTLLRIINGIFKPDEGSIFIDGDNVFENEEIKQQMAFVPDDLFFYQGYTLKEMAGIYKAMYKDFDMNNVEKLAKLFKLDMKKSINKFSKGMKRQAALICALSTNARYLFLDETFDGLDPIIRNEIKKVIASQMDKKDMTIIMTSHNLRELEDICDNLGLLFKGGILFESDIDSIKSNMFKIQISLKGDFDKETFSELDIMSFKKMGSVATIIIKDTKGLSRQILESMNPIILDYVPLTLEEVFIYEMEVLGYEFNNIIE